MTPSSTHGGMTISTGPGSNSPHGSTHGSGAGTPVGPLSSGGGPGSAPPGLSSSQGPPSVGPPVSSSTSGPPPPGMPPMSTMHSSHGGVPMGPMSAPPHGMMGPGGPPPPGMLNRMSNPPLSMNEKVYPPGQPMVFNSQNPSAPPIYPCGTCRREVHDNDQAILCESGCNFWYHRACTGLTETAFVYLTQEVFAEWVCDSCFKQKEVPVVKFKP
jgi:hypothetical protein